MRPTALTSSRTTPSTALSSSARQQRRQPRCQGILCQAKRSTGAAATTVVAAPPPTSSNGSSSSSPASRLTAPERLRDPASIGARGSATAAVRQPSGEQELSLHAYMTLPVEQYYILDPTKVQFIAGNKFVLSVPRIQLLGASLQPVIEVAVRSEPDAVQLEATDCKLNATGIMGGLDSKFALKFATKLTWSSQQQQQQSPQRQPPPAAAAAVAAAGKGGGQPSASEQLASGWAALRSGSWRSSPGSPSSSSSSSARGAVASLPTAGSITGSALVQVWCEVVPPFHLMPREVLEGSLNSVLMGLINSLLPWFMGQLAADYQKWAADESYRAARRLRSTNLGYEAN